jgi:uncharacterized protein (TIGR03435 family)
MSVIIRLILGVTLAYVAWSQDSNPEFEVATIKRSDPNYDAGQMIRDPRLVAIAHASIQNLMAQAFRIKNFQISGPGWLDTDRFDIIARIPEGATQDQLPAMLQALLRDRFGLAFHKEQRRMIAYVLRPKKGAARSKTLNTPIGDIRTTKGAARLRLSGNLTLPYFAGLLSNMVDRPVVDMTDLEGVYRVDLEWSADSATGDESDGSASLSAALQEKLGLYLETRKTLVDQYVIEYVDRVPTEN